MSDTGADSWVMGGGAGNSRITLGGHPVDKSRINRAKRLATKSDEDCWALAKLAWEAIDQDGEPAGEWAEAVGLSRRSVERMRVAHLTYRSPDATRAPHEGRSFWEHVELAGLTEIDAQQLIEAAGDGSVRTARQKRDRTALDDLAVLERAHRAVGRTVLDIRKRELSKEECETLLAEVKALETEIAVLMLYLRPDSIGPRVQAAADLASV